MGFRCLALLLGCCILSAGGCASVVISPDEMRPEWFAQPVSNLHEAPAPGPMNRLNSERIARGDVLEVTIATRPGSTGTSTSPVRVGDDGYADILLVGRVELAGLLPNQAEQAILAGGIRAGMFKRANIVVLIDQPRVNRVMIIGAVNKQGPYELPRNDSHLIAGIAAAEGFSKEASTIIEITRPALINPRGRRQPRGPQFDPRLKSQPVSYGNSPGEQGEEGPVIERPGAQIRIDLADPNSYANGGLYLEDGDVVKVMPRNSQPIHVLGLVKESGQFELEPNKNMRLLDGIALAGGRTTQMADKIHLIRQIPGRADPLVIEISVSEAKLHGHGNLLLMPGDVISVEQTPVTMVLDTIKTFVRFSIGSSLALF